MNWIADVNDNTGNIASVGNEVGYLNLARIADATANLEVALGGLSSQSSYKDIADAIANALNQGDNVDFINELEMDFIQLNSSAEIIIMRLYEALPNEDGAQIVGKFYNSLFAYSQINPTGLSDFAHYLNIYQNTYPEASSIIANVQEAVGSASSIDVIAENVLAAINASDDSNLKAILDYKIHYSGIGINTFKEHVNNYLVGSDIAQIATSYFSIFNVPDANSFNLFTAMFTKAIDIEHNLYSKSYASIMADIQNAIATLPSTDYVPLYETASALASVFHLDDSFDFISKFTAVFVGNDPKTCIPVNVDPGTDINPYSPAAIVNSILGSCSPNNVNPLGFILLNEAILKEHLENLTSYENMIANLTNALNGLSGKYNFKDVAKTIANAVNAGDRADLIRAMEIDFVNFSDSEHGLKEYLVYNLGTINGEVHDAAPIVKKIYSAMSFVLSRSDSVFKFSSFIDNFDINIAQMLEETNILIGSGKLDTVASSITGAINEIYEAQNNLSNNYIARTPIQLGKTGNFYVCRDFDNLINIANGSTRLEDKLVAQQQCNNWAVNVAGYFSGPASVLAQDMYVAAGFGSCFKLEDKITTLPNSEYGFYLPDLKVECDQVSCNSASAIVFDYEQNQHELPSLEVGCELGYCSTSSYILNEQLIPALPVISISTTANGLENLCNYILDH